MRRALKIAIFSCALLLTAWLFIDTVRLQNDSLSAVRSSSPNPIVGIWKGQHGTILDLRADGTVRCRSIDDSTNVVHFYKYRLSDDKLFFYYSAKPDEYLRRMRQAAFGMRVEEYDLANLNNSELQLIDVTSGEKYKYERTEDSILATTQ